MVMFFQPDEGSVWSRSRQFLNYLKSEGRARIERCFYSYGMFFAICSLAIVIYIMV